MPARVTVLATTWVLACSTSRVIDPSVQLLAALPPEPTIAEHDPQAGATIVIGNSMVGHAQRGGATLSPGPLRWGPWQGLCCTQGARTRQCRVVARGGFEECRAQGRLALVCQRALGCTGAECVCCSNGLEHACRLEGRPPRDELGPVRPRSAPSIWSPQ